MLGHNTNEGLLFTNPAIANNSAVDNDILLDFPDINTAVRAYIENVLYPPVFDGTYGYKDEISRTALRIAESTFA